MAPRPEPALKAVGATKAYADLVALSPLSLEVPAGQMLALVGHNGSGKSTFLRLAAGLLELPPRQQATDQDDHAADRGHGPAPAQGPPVHRHASTASPGSAAAPYTSGLSTPTYLRFRYTSPKSSP